MNAIVCLPYNSFTETHPPDIVKLNCHGGTEKHGGKKARMLRLFHITVSPKRIPSYYFCKSQFVGLVSDSRRRTPPPVLINEDLLPVYHDLLREHFIALVDSNEINTIAPGTTAYPGAEWQGSYIPG